MNSARFSPPSAAAHLPLRGDPAERETEIDLLGMLRTLWRGKWLILLITLCAVALMAYYVWALAIPLYTATSTVALQNRDEKVVDFTSIMSGIGADEGSVNTEMEVLRSRGLINKLVDKLNLGSDPEFNVYLRERQPSILGGLLGQVLGPGQLATPPSPRVVHDKIVSEVLDALTIDRIRQSFVFTITAETHEPAKSALIADALAELYIRDQLDVKFDATEQATEWLTDRVSQLKTDLERAENAAQEFNSSIQLISPERLEALNVQLKDFRDRYAGLVAQQQELEQRAAELSEASDGGDLTRMAEVADMPGLMQLAEGDTADQEAFRRRYDQLLSRARFEAQRSQAQVDAMKKSIADLERQVADQSTQALKLEQLKREAEASRLIYEYFLGRLKETSVQQGIQQADARVLSYATLPLEPSAPRKGLLLSLAGFIGVLIGSVIVVLLETRQNSFRTAEDMEQQTGTSVIGQIPRAPYSRRKRILDYIIAKPTSAVVEAVRNLRTSILLSSVDRTPKVIMLTSSMPGEGKTTLSLALAHNLAGLGKKVLLIEGDIRRRTFSEFFDVKGRGGLLAAVLEEGPLDDIVFHDPRLGFEILFGEHGKVNAADFFSSTRFTDFLERMRGLYDFIVIDTPPVLMVPDARVIAQSSDAVVYVVHWDKTPRRQVQQGIAAFASVNAPVTGLVLSQIDPRGMKRYGYSGTYGQGYSADSPKYYQN